MHAIVSVLLAMLAVYLCAGVGFAVAFHARGLVHVDPSARGAGLGFRMIISPGIIALWPWLLLRWRKTMIANGPIEPLQPESAPRRLRRVHANAWRILAVLGPVIVALALVSRPAEPPASLAPWTVPQATQSNPSR